MNCRFCNKPILKCLNLASSKIYFCSSCNIASTYPPPVIPEYDKMDFHSCTKENENEQEKLTDINALPADWKKLIFIQAALIKKYLPKGGRILEIGCGEGLLLNELQKNNYHVFGIEPSEAAFKRAQFRGIDVKNGYFSNQKFDGKFDVVIMSHVLEHIENINETILKIKEIAPNGYLMLTQTNYRGLIPRVRKEKWYAWVPEQHFWHFTLFGLTKILSKYGYRRKAHKYSSLVHPNGKLYKIAQLKSNLIDQFTALYKL